MGFFPPRDPWLTAAEGFPKSHCISTFTHQFGSATAQNSLVYCEQPQLEPGVFAKLVPLYQNPGSEKHPQQLMKIIWVSDVPL